MIAIRYGILQVCLRANHCQVQDLGERPNRAMHKSNYRPNRSQQLSLRSIVPQHWRNETIVVHHVLEDTPNRLYVQIERRHTYGQNTDITFERIEL